MADVPFDPERHARRFATGGAVLVFLGLAVADLFGLPLMFLGFACLLLAAYSRRDGLLLVGPLARWELTRAGRRRRLFVFRILLIGAMFVFLTSVFSGFVPGPWYNVFTASGTTIAANRAGWAAEQVYAVIGFSAVAVALIGIVSQIPPVIAEVRGTKRLDHVLVTDLRSREILLGKVVGRLGVLAGYVLLALPVLTVLSWFGGVDSEVVLVAAAMTSAVLLGVLGLALLNAGAANAPADAVSGTVGAAMLYLLMTGGCEMAAQLSPRFSQWSGVPVPDPVVAVLRFLASGNPWVSGYRLSLAGSSATTVATILSHFAAGHWLLLCMGWAVAVRGVRQELTPAPSGKEVKARKPPSPLVRPPVGDEPVYWYEVSTALNQRRGPPPGRYVKWIGVGLGVIGIAVLYSVFVAGWFLPEVRRDLRPLAASTGAFAVLGVTIPAAFVAARSVPKERAADTLEALRLTALSPREILAQKWDAALTVSRFGFFIFLGVWAYLTACRLLPIPVAILLAVVTYCIRPFAASVGLRVGLTASSPGKAAARLMGFGVAYCYGIGMLITGLDFVGRDRYAPYVYAALVPPAGQAMVGVAFSPRRSPANREIVPMILALAGGGLVCAAGSRLAWRSAARVFDSQLTPAPDETAPPERPTG